jgi:hypothetical protein
MKIETKYRLGRLKLEIPLGVGKDRHIARHGRISELTQDE